MKNQFKLLALAFVAATSFSANAANTATATLNATLNIQGQCSFSSSSYNVTKNDVVNSSPETSVNITYNCASGFTPTLSSLIKTTTDIEGNTIVAAVFPDSSFTTPIEDAALSLTADGTDTTIPLYVKFAKQDGGGIPKPGTYVFAIPLIINY